MSVIEISSIIAAGAAVIGAFVSFFSLFRIARVEHATNGMKTDLIETAKRMADEAGFRRGLIAGWENQKLLHHTDNKSDDGER